MTTPGPAGPLPPYVPPGQGGPRHGNGVGLAALIVGIVALLLAVVPLVSFVAFLPALAAIVLGIVGLVLQGRRRGTSIAGLILGGVALVVAIVISVISLIGLGGRFRSELATPSPSDVTATANPPVAPTSTATPGVSLAPGPHTVVYRITGSGTATVNYGTFVGGDTSASAGKRRALPFHKTVAIRTTAADSFASFTVGATQLDPKDPVGCSITVDGRVISSKRSDSTTLAIVFCSVRTTF